MMDSATLGGLLNGAMPVETPIAAVLVSEKDLADFAFAARSVVFEALSDSLPSGMVAASNIAELDRTSESFADMLDLDAANERRAELRRSAAVVSDWLDAGCITLPPTQQIRALAEALL